MAISKVVYKSSASATPVIWMDATPATAEAADITSPKTAMLADGVMTTGTGSGGGGGGIDMPTITVTVDDNWEQIISASFDKTYRECVAYVNDDVAIANVIEVNQSGTEQYPATAAMSISGGSGGTFYQTYTVIHGTKPAFDVKYNSNGAVEITNPSAMLKTLNITSNGTYYPAGADYIEEVNVSVPSSQPNLQTKTNISPTTSSQTIQADSGFDGLSSVQINAMPTGSVSTPATTITANPSISVSSSGLITASVSGSQSITPSVSAGYVSSGTAGTVSVSGSKTQQLTTKAAATITPTKSAQTIASGTYLTGTQTIAAIPAEYQDVTGVTASASDVVSGKDIVNSSGTVVHGSLVIQTYYTGSSAPSSSLGSNGDIYLKTL